MKKSPLTLVKERFGDKKQLVAAVQALTTDELWLGRLSKDRGGEKGLEHVSNAKLLRLHGIFSEVKEQFGTRDKLIAAIGELEHRAPEDARLASWPVPRLYDHYKSAKKRAARTAKA